MQKELNPDLFGERKKTQSAVIDPVSSFTSTEPAFLNVDRQIFELKNQMQGLGEQILKVSVQLSEFVKSSNLKMERLQQQVARLETNHNGLVQETGHKLVQLNHKLADRKSIDAKIQDMVDRHSQVIKSFEVRMNHLQKLLSDKEAQMVSAQTSLNEAKMEIARLKRA